MHSLYLQTFSYITFQYESNCIFKYNIEPLRGDAFFVAFIDFTLFILTLRIYCTHAILISSIIYNFVFNLLTLST